MTPSQDIALGSGLAALLVALVLAALRRRSRRIAETIAYLRGVQYVLSDAPDAAIGELTRAVELNPNATGQSIETYFALGKLFRRKGDLEHAIRLHQNILLRPGLPPEVKREAQLQLAIDFQRAGLLAQASSAYEKFLAEAPAHPEALTNLRQVYEVGQDFEAAAEVQIRAVKAGLGGEKILAHLLAEAARRALAKDPEHAQKLAEGAVQASAESEDAQLALAEVLGARGQKRQAEELLRRLLGRSAEVALHVEPLLARALEPREVEAALGPVEGAPPARLVAIGRARLRAGDREGAIEALRLALIAEPGLAPARGDLGALLLGAEPGPALRPAYEELLRALARPELEWTCVECTHAATSLAWQCPRCHAWDSFSRGQN